MSVNPEQSPEPVTNAQAQVSDAAEPQKARRGWPARLLNICFAIFALEIGIFLVVFPWMDDVWKINYFQAAVPALHHIWEDPYFRGALTGLGLLNCYVACWELLRALRRS
jgi:hypothetical protein